MYEMLDLFFSLFVLFCYEIGKIMIFLIYVGYQRSIKLFLLNYLRFIYLCFITL